MTNNDFRAAMLGALLVISAAMMPLVARAQPWPDLHWPAQMSCANAVGCLGHDFTNWVDNTPAGGLKPTTPPAAPGGVVGEGTGGWPSFEGWSGIGRMAR
jgi:hypothetical protein